MIGDLIGSLIAYTALALLTLLGTEQMGSCWGEWKYRPCTQLGWFNACPWDPEFTGATSELPTYLARWGPLGGHPKFQTPRFAPLSSVPWSPSHHERSVQAVVSQSNHPACCRPSRFSRLLAPLCSIFWYLYTYESFVTAGLIITRVFAPDLHRLLFFVHCLAP